MRQQGGFTVIEVTIFLAISGTMAIMLLVGVGVAIQRQQYRDAVQSFASFLTDQYTKVISVENDRTAADVCPIPGAASGGHRGQSNCVVVGRYITSQDEGRSFRTRPIFALLGVDGKTWSYRTSDVTAYDYQTAWNVKTRLAEHANRDISFAMLRHPATGELTIHADSKVYAEDKLHELIQGNDNSRSEVCVYDDQWLAPERLSVFLEARAGSSEALSVKEASDGCKAA